MCVCAYSVMPDLACSCFSGQETVAEWTRSSSNLLGSLCDYDAFRIVFHNNGKHKCIAGWLGGTLQVPVDVEKSISSFGPKCPSWRRTLVAITADPTRKALQQGCLVENTQCCSVSGRGRFYDGAFHVRKGWGVYGECLLQTAPVSFEKL